MNTPKTLNEVIARKRYVIGLLELACQELELPDTKRNQAETAYKSVGDWLSECPTLGQFDPVIFPQGSMALGTTVRPLDREEFDVDLVCHLARGDDSLPQASIKKDVGARLMSNETYRKMCEEFKRCWRLNYAEASQLHLDITPAVNNRGCSRGGLCVTDKDARAWQPTHPKGYIDWFLIKSKRVPKFPEHLLENRVETFSAKNVEDLPENLRIKGYLRRTVQLIKRQRSIYFEKHPDLAPISIILTTLAAKAYEQCCMYGPVYDTEFDLVYDIIQRMPAFIEIKWNGSQKEFWIPNETTNGENFAEKWNKKPELAGAFDEWHAVALKVFRGLADAEDSESTIAALSNVASKTTAENVRAKTEKTITQARIQKVLRTSSTGALTLGAGVPVRSNTYFGK